MEKGFDMFHLAPEGRTQSSASKDDFWLTTGPGPSAVDCLGTGRLFSRWRASGKGSVTPGLRSHRRVFFSSMHWENGHWDIPSFSEFLQLLPRESFIMSVFIL